MRAFDRFLSPASFFIIWHRVRFVKTFFQVFSIFSFALRLRSNRLTRDISARRARTSERQLVHNTTTRDSCQHLFFTFLLFHFSVFFRLLFTPSRGLRRRDRQAAVPVLQAGRLRGRTRCRRRPHRCSWPGAPDPADGRADVPAHLPPSMTRRCRRIYAEHILRLRTNTDIHVSTFHGTRTYCRHLPIFAAFSGA